MWQRISVILLKLCTPLYPLHAKVADWRWNAIQCKQCIITPRKLLLLLHHALSVVHTYSLIIINYVSTIHHLNCVSMLFDSNVSKNKSKSPTVDKAFNKQHICDIYALHRSSNDRSFASLLIVSCEEKCVTKAMYEIFLIWLDYLVCLR